MPLLRRAFLDHPASVNETYLEHLAAASVFGLRMVAGGLACLVHALLPCCFERTGSDQVRRLHERMVSNRQRHLPRQAEQPASGGR
ncbi:DUF6356 family protein [Phenylobacterium sp. LjRoot225]|uniref:DUF6356 family protein n=1 Tax=Phenylobacterium sp. LjRoot225 TaxID=3342285 RepID=UPI003ED0AD14